MEIFQKSGAKTKVTVRQVDNQARAASRSTKCDAHTSEKVLAAMLKKIELDFKSHEKVDDMAQKMTQEQIDEVKAIEAAKASDALFIEFGLDADQILDCARHYKLIGNVQVRKTSLKFGKEFAVRKAAKVYIKNKPEQSVLDKVIAEVNALGEAQFEQDGTLTFDFFCKTSLIVLQHKKALTLDVLKDKCQERRRALKIKNDALYRSLTSESQVFKKNTKSHLQECVYDTAKVPKEVLIKTLKKYMTDPELRAKYDANVKD